ncbi:MAG TPA: ABC transporter permease [Solirubrobacterales bacterium]|nr:ABC transporter permease [Solirubrobacterales bacterium]
MSPSSPARFPTQVRLLTERAAIRTLKSPVLIVNLVLALLFLVVYNGTVGGIDLFASFGGGSYFTFVLPAAILAASIGGGAAGLMLVSDIESGYLQRQLAMPVQRSAVVLSLVIVAALQVALQATLVILVGVLLGADSATGVLGLASVLGLALVWGAGFAAYSVAVAISSRDIQVTAAANLIFVPLIFFSPLLVPYRYLEPWMQAIADVNPTRYVMEGMRSLLIVGWNAEAVAEAAAATCLFGLAMGAFAVAVLRWRLPDGFQ